MFRMVQPQTSSGIRDKQVKTRAIRDFSRTQSDKIVALDECSLAPGDSVSSFSSMESLSPRSRERSRSRDVRDRNLPQPQTSYSWRKNFQSNFSNLIEEEKVKKEVEDQSKQKTVKEKQVSNRVMTSTSDNFNNQSPSMSILQIKLSGESRLRSHSELSSYNTFHENTKKLSTNIKDAEKSTFDVDVQEKREIFEGKQDDHHDKPRVRRFRRQESLETQSKAKTSRENWNSIREKHCPVTSALVNQEKGESLRSSILGDQKISFKNLKFTKACPEDVGSSDTKTDKSIASTKEFEDTATEILNQMRKQRRTLQMEYVSKVSVSQTKKPTSGWRDRISSRTTTDKALAGGVSVQTAAVGPRAQASTAHSKSNKVEAAKKEEPKHPVAKFSNPLDFILMKEEYVKKNPPTKKSFVRQRSVESDSEEMSMESVMKSLKKIVKAINPKREFSQDKEERVKHATSEPEKRKRVELVAGTKPRLASSVGTAASRIELQTKVREDFSITEKAPSRDSAG